MDVWLPILIFVLAAGGASVLRRVRREYYRELDEKRGGYLIRCTRCSYDLSAHDAPTATVCPECGSVLARDGVFRWPAWGKLKEPNDRYAIARFVWILALVILGPLFLLLIITRPPVAFVHHDENAYGLTPLSGSLSGITVHLEQWYVWDQTEREVASEPSRVRRQFRHRFTVRSGRAGVDELDLLRTDLEIDDIEAWVRAVDPKAPAHEVEHLTEHLAYIGPATREALMARTGNTGRSPANMLTWTGVVFSQNGVVVGGGSAAVRGVSVWEQFRAEIGKPSIAQSTATHAWRAIAFGSAVLLLIALPWLVRLGMGLVYRHLHRRWVRDAQSRSSS